MLRKLLVSLLFLGSVPAMSQICAPSNAVGIDGIGDGCSTHSLEYVFPELGIFKGTFTPACDVHDKCLSQLGANYPQCDSAFYADLRNRCDDKFNQWLQPAEWALCRQTAFEYYTGVKQWGADPGEQRNLQTDARNRSLWQQSFLDSDTCGTTPERTTLYAPGLITQINNAYLSYAGRLPTVYEFVGTANAGDIVNNRGGWDSLLYTLAAQAAAVRPPSVAWTHVGSRENFTQTLTVNPTEPGVAYRWRLTLGFGEGPTKVIQLQEPRYNAVFPIKGFVKATGAGNVRNLAIVDYEVRVRGSCGVVSGPCR